MTDDDTMRRYTPEEIAWVELQPVVGTPSLTRLRAALNEVGLPALRLALDAGRENLDFWLCRSEEVRGLDKNQMHRRLITVFRASGFDLGFSELGIVDLNPTTLYGVSLVGPIDEVCENGPPPVEP